MTLRQMIHVTSYRGASISQEQGRLSLSTNKVRHWISVVSKETNDYIMSHFYKQAPVHLIVFQFHALKDLISMYRVLL